MPRYRVIGVLLIVTGLSAMYTGSAVSQVANNPSSEEIIKQLKPKERTRSFKRGIKVQGRTGVEEPPSIDLQINFEFGSAKLTTDAQLLLKNLARALNDDALKSYEFQIAGHTDAVGRADRNLELSRSRAQSVKDFLVFYYDVSPKRLHTIGHGESRLLDEANPNAATNRRVEIVNKALSSNRE